MIVVAIAARAMTMLAKQLAFSQPDDWLSFPDMVAPSVQYNDDPRESDHTIVHYFPAAVEGHRHWKGSEKSGDCGRSGDVVEINHVQRREAGFPSVYRRGFQGVYFPPWAGDNCALRPTAGNRVDRFSSRS